MRKLIMSEHAMCEYSSWVKSGNKKVADKIDALLKEVLENPFEGTGKPEPLVGNLSGKWSRRITSKDRLVYSATDDAITVYQCKGHYSDR